MILTTAAESRKLDHIAMEAYGLPEAVLMENAGASVVALTSEEVNWEGASVTILCGTGNNGGDGFVTARYAAEAGADVVILLMGHSEHMGESARMYRKAAERMGIPVVEISRAEEAMPYIRDASIIVDALIGTGLEKAVTGEKAALITCLDDAEAVILSVDVPSGMNADTGRAEGAVVSADYTVALGSLKRGHILYPGREYCGRILYSPIGIPDAARDELDAPVRLVEKEDVRDWLPRRSPVSHKGKNGFTGLFAGSDGMAGAGLLAAQGALYGGAGKVALVTVKEAERELAGKVPEVMVSALSEEAPYFLESQAEEAAEKAAAYQAVALGCGLGRAEETQKFAVSFMKELSQVVVVDADALYGAAKKHFDFHKGKGTYILTPHVGEFATLTGLSPKDIEACRIDEARKFAKEQGVVLVLKGVPTVTALPDGRAWVNTTGNPGMATGGMGDTLTGVIAALAGQGLSAEEAAAAGVYLHGLAGDILAEKTPVGYTAGDLARALPLARKMTEEA